jgi:hypothetical protein
MPSVKGCFFVFFLSLLFLLLSSLLVCAIGISPADVYIDFVPNQEFIIDYSITSYRPFTFYVEGPFSEFTTIDTISKSDSQGIYRLHLTLPDDYKTPGKHRMYVAGRETPLGGTVGAVAVIRGFIEIDVPFPGYYADMDISVVDVNEDQPVYISITAHNRGKLNISNARLQLRILADDTTVKSLDSETVAIDTNRDYTFSYSVPARELKPGSYKAYAVLSYEGGLAEKSANFRVGTFDVAIVNYTDKMLVDYVNPFDITVESRWNNPISTVYMDLSIVNNSKVLSTSKTPPFDLPPWQKQTSSFYWNTAGIPVGEYDLDIVIHYEQQVKNEKRKVFIVESLPAEVEAPSIPMSTVLLLIIALIIVAFNIYFIVTGRRKQKEEEK